ncbi:MAG: type II toxin-antitoxin system Phd/YefM family antitoxin [Desulfobacterales bacterium]
MPTLSATEARSKLYRLIDQTASSHEPIVITSKRAETRCHYWQRVHWQRNGRGSPMLWLFIWSMKN